MRVTLGYKQEEFEKLLAINDECYSGIELPTITEFQNMLAHTDVFVARRKDNDCSPDTDPIIGFAIVRPGSERTRPYLWSIAVTKYFQGRGVGGNLLREVIKKYTLAKEYEILLHVHPDNPAQKLYFDYGFRVESIAPHWYGNRHGLFMRRPL